MDKDKIFSKLLNNTGFFLELAFLNFTNSYGKFITRTQVPFTNNWQGKEPINGVMDFLCLHVNNDRSPVYYSIECKKVDKSKKEWVFFKRNHNEAESVFFCKSKKMTTPMVMKDKIICDPICDRAIQIIGSKETLQEYSINKDPIYASAIQAQNGIRHVIYEDNYQKFALQNNHGEADRVLYVPIVITTADLYIYKTNFDDLDISTGVVDGENASFEKRKWVEYSLPVPEHLQIRGIDRNSVFIVNSSNIKQFFDGAIKGFESLYS